MSDTLFDLDIHLPKKMLRGKLLEEGKIFDISSACKFTDLSCKAAITMGLFHEIYPFAEDGVKGVTFEERVGELLTQLKKSRSSALQPDYLEFKYTFSTYVKHAKSHDEVTTFLDGKARDKTVTVFVVSMPDEFLNPSLLLGFKDKELKGGTSIDLEKPKAAVTYDDYQQQNPDSDPLNAS
jgi:hypothetical protein